MQAEIGDWCQDLFHGSKEGYSLLTHGGTSSIIEAMSAYVVLARERGILHPEIVVPQTAHAAFKKAAKITGATLIKVPVNPQTGAVTATDMRNYISGNTAVIVGSAPSFMYGVNDPIGDLGKLAIEKNVPLHVDACLGGFLTAFLDTSSEPMDFRVPGVSSISADLHKYGYCPKGTSVVLFSKTSPALPTHAELNWNGGLYVTPGMLDGSTSGARVAEAYVTMSYYGRKKYQEIAENILALQQRIQSRVARLSQEVDGLTTGDIYLFGNPKWSVLGFRSANLNPYLIADEMEELGWKLSSVQNPDGFHLCLTHVHTLVEGFEEKFFSDLTNATLTAKAAPTNIKPSGNVKVYGEVGLLPTSLQRDVSIIYQKARLRNEYSSSSPRLFTEQKQPEEMGSPTSEATL